MLECHGFPHAWSWKNAAFCRCPIQELAPSKATITLALPLAFTQVLQIGINTTDVLLTGRLGPEALAAGQLAMSLYMPLWLFGLGLAVAVSPMAAQAEGAGEVREVRRVIRQGFWVVLAYSVPAMAVLWNAEALLLLAGQEPATAAAAQGFLRAMMWSTPTSLCLIVLRCFISALSRPQTLVWILAIGILVNLAGDWLLMFGHWGFPALGLVGAGLVTSLVYLGMVVALSLVSLRDAQFRQYALFQRWWRADWGRFREILQLGLPIGTGIVAESGMFAAAGLIMGRISTESLAAHAVAMQCAVIAFMLPLGISQASTVRVGLAVGARVPNGVGRAGWSAIGIGPLVLFVSAMVFLVFPDLLVDAFSITDGEVRRLAVSFLAVAAFFQLFDGTQIIALGALRGIRDTRVPMFLAIFSYWGVGFPLCYWLGLHTDLGGLGVWIGLASALALNASLLLLRFRFQERRWRPVPA